MNLFQICSSESTQHTIGEHNGVRRRPKPSVLVLSHGIHNMTRSDELHIQGDGLMPGITFQASKPIAKTCEVVIEMKHYCCEK